MQYLKYIIFVLIVIGVILFTMMTQKHKEEIPLENRVAVSTFAIYDIVKHVSQGSVEILNILPFGVDAHSFEPTPKLVAQLEKSRLIIYNGAGLEPWTDGFNFQNRVLNLSEHVSLRELESGEFEHHEYHDHQCAHSKVDPHYWLDIQNMIISTNIVTQELIKLYPENENLYTENAQNYMNRLKILDADYAKSLNSCVLDTIITNHNAFSYISSKYNFEVEALSGFSPEAQASAKDIMRLMNHVQEHGVSTIFFESFVSDKSMRSIANDMNINIDVLQPLGNITADEAENNVSYEMVMRKNLEKISKALMCN